MSTASNTTLDQVEIFKPGKRRAMNGTVYDITAADVVACAEGYDPALSEAPHVVGHPQTDNPAYGWVEGLQAVDGGASLVITTSRQVEPAFAELVLSGRYPKRSAAFYPPDHEANPKPGIWYLKHVGHLGAAPPAVKGLRAIAAHSADQAGIVEFGEWSDEVQAGLWRRLRDWFISQYSLEDADRVLPTYDIDSLQREALKPETYTARSPIGFTEGAPQVTNPNQAVLDERQAQLDAREAGIKAREDAQAALVKSARSVGITAFAESMIHEGKWLPADKARWVAFMEGLPEAARVVEFAEGDATKPTETPALEVFQAMSRKGPKLVEFAEIAGEGRTVQAVDMTSAAEIGKAAAEFVEAEKKAGRDTTFELAVQHVTDTQKEKAQ